MVTVRVALHGGVPRLQVIDNGPGIAPAERDAVFRRFYRGESGQSVEGTGLGLSIVREIARLHGAAVELADTPGGGLTVSVNFSAAGHKPETCS
ncbi:Sensor histidine kinase TodS [compost metagenome]